MKILLFPIFVLLTVVATASDTNRSCPEFPASTSISAVARQTAEDIVVVCQKTAIARETATKNFRVAHDALSVEILAEHSSAMTLVDRMADYLVATEKLEVAQKPLRKAMSKFIKALNSDDKNTVTKEWLRDIIPATIFLDKTDPVIMFRATSQELLRRQ
jgi:hypothetical protein